MTKCKIFYLLTFLLCFFKCQFWASAEISKLPEITLIATRTQSHTFEVPGSTSVIEFGALGAAGPENAYDIVRYNPGVSIPLMVGGGDSYVPYIRGGFSNYRMRGVGGNRVLLTIDGIRQPQQINGAGGNGRQYYDPSVFKRVQILQGSGSTLHGSDAIGGIVAFETVASGPHIGSSENKHFLEAALGSVYNSVNSAVNYTYDASVSDESWHLMATRSTREGNQRKNDKGSMPANPLDFDSEHTLANIKYSGLKNQVLSITYEEFLRNELTSLDSLIETVVVQDGSQGPRQIADDYYASSEGMRNRRRWSINYEKTFVDAFIDKIKVHRYSQDAESSSQTDTKQRMLYTYSYGTPLAQTVDFITRDRTDTISFDSHIYGYSAVFEKTSYVNSTNHKFIFGLERTNEYANNDFIRNDRAGSFPVQLDRPVIDAASSLTTGLYLQDIIEYGKWRFQFGARMDEFKITPSNKSAFLDQVRYSTYGFLMPNSVPLPEAGEYNNRALAPSFSWQYDLSDSLRIWGKYSEAIRNPSVENYVGFFNHSVDGARFLQIPNPDLEEERSESYELGIKGYLFGIKSEINGYHNNYKGFIGIADAGLAEDGTRIQQPQNIGNLEVRGLDASFRYDFTSDSKLTGAYAGLSLSYAEGKNKRTGQGVQEVDPLTTVGSLGYTGELGSKKYGFSIYGTYRAKRSSIPDNYSFYVPGASFVVDLKGYIKLNDRVELAAGLRNITDQKYWIWGSSSNAVHAFNNNTEMTPQPGMNGFIAIEVGL